MTAVPVIDPIPASPPDPATLDAPGVARLFGALRQRRLDLMVRLAALEAQAADPAANPAAFIDRMETQAELQELLGYMRRLQARAKSIEVWEPADRMVPEFAEMGGDGRHWVAGRGLCPLTPDSVLFLHGPVVLWYAAALAERLLAPDDRLAWLRKAGFHKELMSEPRLVVWDTAAEPPPGVDRADAAVQGLFETAQGRLLAFAAIPDPARPLTRKADYHSIVPEIAARPPTLDRENWRFRYTFGSGAWPSPGQVVSGAAAVFAMVEALVTAFSHALDDGQHLFLFSAIADRAIPQDFAAWLAAEPQYQIDLSWERKRAVPGRGMFVPGRYRVLPHDADWTRGVMVCLNSHLLF